MAKFATWAADGRDDLFKFAPEKLVIVTDKSHPLYDERVDLPLDEALVRNIMFRGVIEPIVVRLNGKREDGSAVVEVVDGRQRVRATIEANKRLAEEGKPTILVPGVRRRGEAADFAGVMISANELRKSDSPLIKARKLERFLATGRDEEEAAITFGVSVQTIKNMLKLLELHPTVQKAVEKNNLPASVAKELSDLPQEQQPAALEKLIESGNVKGARAMEAVKNVKKGQKAEASTARMMSRKALESWKSRLKEASGKESEIAYAVVARILGGERALANYPQLRDSFAEPVEVDKPKKVEKPVKKVKKVKRKAEVQEAAA